MYCVAVRSILLSIVGEMATYEALGTVEMSQKLEVQACLLFEELRKFQISIEPYYKDSNSSFNKKEIIIRSKV